ncbi:Fe3+ hydroxamate ABC transporter substrate-binding protein [Sphingomonas sp. Leaf339]|uniref:GxxExxY protein n=1 Tax=Sphingomonas sp. Leaf339 TaxID=1736343 RepID=UPI0006FC5582|nr:GxxExxY protein [Sphingomonas sp. Leaf339]KQU62414.1 Fe3+ hydroxamate ABC transporter substrate-binding protein [Sphingomonas sp. Leaf339]
MFTRSREDAKRIDLEAIAADIIDVSFRLHRDLGPGLLESVYETVLAAKLARSGYDVARQVAVSFSFEGIDFDAAFRVDIVVEQRLLVEIKSVERLNAAHGKQLLTYLRLTEQPLGLLKNFGGATLKEGLRRVVNGHTNFASSRLRVNQPSGD